MEEMSVLRLTGEALPPRMTASFMTVCFQNQEESRAQRPLAGLRCLWAECYAQGAAIPNSRERPYAANHKEPRL